MPEYEIVDDDDLTPEQARRLDEAAAEAEAGCTAEQLADAPTLSVNPFAPSGEVVVPLNDSQSRWLMNWANAHHMTKADVMLSFLNEHIGKSQPVSA